MWNQINPYIRRAWYNTLAPGERIRERVIFDYEFLFVKQGHATIAVEGMEYIAAPDDLFIFRPRQSHAIQVASDCSMVQPHIHFDLLQYPDAQQVPVSYRGLGEMSEIEKGYFRTDLLATMLTPCPTHIRLKNPRYVEFLFADVIYTHQHRSEYNEVYEKSLFLKLLYQIILEIKRNTNQQMVPKSEHASLVRQYLEQNLDRSVTIQELSQVHNLSKSYLLSLFSASYQTTPLRYHQMMRIDKAKHLLLYTNASVSEVGANIGIPDLQAFSRLFKRVEGVSPRAFRTGSYKRN